MERLYSKMNSEASNNRTILFNEIIVLLFSSFCREKNQDIGVGEIESENLKSVEIVNIIRWISLSERVITIIV